MTDTYNIIRYVTKLSFYIKILFYVINIPWHGGGDQGPPPTNEKVGKGGSGEKIKGVDGKHESGSENKEGGVAEKFKYWSILEKIVPFSPKRYHFLEKVYHFPEKGYPSLVKGYPDRKSKN